MKMQLSSCVPYCNLLIYVWNGTAIKPVFILRGWFLSPCFHIHKPFPFFGRGRCCEKDENVHHQLTTKLWLSYICFEQTLPQRQQQQLKLKCMFLLIFRCWRRRRIRENEHKSQRMAARWFQEESYMDNEYIMIRLCDYLSFLMFNDLCPLNRRQLHQQWPNDKKTTERVGLSPEALTLISITISVTHSLSSCAKSNCYFYRIE